MRYVLLPLWVAALLGGCGQEPGPGDTLPEVPAATGETVAEQGPGRDLGAVDVCALVPAEAVAAAAGATVEGPAAATDPGYDGKGCEYQLRIGGLRKSPEISLHPPGTCDFWRDMQTFELEDLPGLGDRAFWGKRTDQTDLFVLRSNDVCVHVQAHGQELPQAQAIAEVVLGRL